MLNTSVLFKLNLNEKNPIVVNQGGTSSAKTVSILQVLAVKAIQEKDIIITVCGQDIPNIKRGALRDFKKYVLCEPSIAEQIQSFNKSERIYTFKNGSIIEFESYADEQDAKNGKRDYLFINEANGVDYMIYNQLQMRTKKQTFIDYNPSSEFWVHEKVIPQTDRVKLLISDYRHNPFCPQSTIDNLMALKDQDEALWKVYGRGMTGKIVGLIYPNWSLCDSMPDHLERCKGLDFGFNHPSALVDVAFDLEAKHIYVDELVYEKGLITTELYNSIIESGVTDQLIYADAARPDTIEELQRLKLNVEKADKTVIDGINKVKSFKIFITKRSANIIKEIKSYKWKEKNGKTLEEPVKFLDDAMDALRYAVWNYTSKESFDYSW